MDKSQAQLAIGASIVLVAISGALKLPDIITTIFGVFFVAALFMWKFSD